MIRLFKIKRQSIRQKILYWAALCILVTVVVNTSFSYINARNEALDAAQKRSQILAKDYSKKISDELSEAVSVAENLGSMLKGSIKNKDTMLTRDEVSEIFKNTLADNPQFIGMSVAFEPNAFDSLDSQFDGDVRYYENGRFATYFSKKNTGLQNQDSKITQEALLDLETSDYYIVPKKTLSNIMIEPYLYEVQGKHVLMTTCSSPIVIDGKYYGVVGVDIEVDFIQELIQGFEDEMEFKDILIISDRGNVVGSKENQDGVLREEMLHFKEGSHVEYSKGIFNVYEPIEIRAMDTQWGIKLSVDQNTIMGAASKLLAKQVVVGLILLAFSLFIFWMAASKIARPIHNLSEEMKKFNPEKLDEFCGSKIKVEGILEAYTLKTSYKNIINELKRDYDEKEKVNWFIKGQADLNKVMHKENDFQNLVNMIIKNVVKHTNGQVGAFFALNEHEDKYDLVASYAYTRRKNVNTSYSPGDGIVGQVAIEKAPIIIEKAPSDYISISSGIGETVPKSIAVIPCIYKGKVNSIIEIAALECFSEIQVEYLKEAANSIAIALNTVKNYEDTQRLLEKTELQAQELQVQQEELRVANEELEEQTKALQKSEAELQAQQEELRVINEELEEQKNSLIMQNSEIEQKNKELETIREDIEKKAEQLRLASKYKSEFLANMSHELRTPLNSILILSEILKENKKGHLTPKQVEFAKTINSSGSDLLNLINDILDLSKVEAGKTEISVEKMSLAELKDDMLMLFNEIAQKKGLEFNVSLESGLPGYIDTDEQKLKQIVKNLLSNAIKFTDSGSVILDIAKRSESQIEFAVKDTGIGISDEKQSDIFEAFNQEDGTTSRKYGGTGLGLSISREYARLLGGKIELESESGKGSIFTLAIPFVESEIESHFENDVNANAGLQSNTPIEDKAYMDPLTEKQDFDSEVAATTQSNSKSILIIEKDGLVQFQLSDYIFSRNPDIEIDTAQEISEGYEMLRHKEYVCLIVNMDTENAYEIQTLEKITADEATGKVPIIVYTDDEITVEKQTQIGKFANEIIIKSEKFSERIFDEIRLFLRSIEKDNKMKDEGKIIAKYSGNQVFNGKKVLVVDDDMRNVFAVSSILEEKNIHVTAASNGREGIEKLNQEDDIDLVIMDIMMPEMDGYEAMKRIRSDSRHSEIPIIAFTAKAMKGDKVKCLEAGANDYLSKPVESEKLLSMLRMWLQK